MAVETLEAKIDANVSGYMKGLEAAGTKAAMFDRLQVDMAANVRKLTEHLTSAGQKAEESSEKFLKFAAVGLVVKKVAGYLEEMGEAAIEAANAFDPSGAREWEKSVNALRDAASTFAADVGGKVRPQLEGLMKQGVEAFHVLDRIDFKSIYQDVSGVLSSIGNAIKAFVGAVAEVNIVFVKILLYPFQALKDQVVDVLDYSFERFQTFAEAAEKLTGKDLGSKMFAGMRLDLQRDFGGNIVDGAVKRLKQGWNDLVSLGKDFVAAQVDAYLKPDTGQKDKHRRNEQDNKDLDYQLGLLEKMSALLNSQAAAARAKADAEARSAEAMARQAEKMMAVKIAGDQAQIGRLKSGLGEASASGDRSSFYAYLDAVKKASDIEAHDREAQIDGLRRTSVDLRGTAAERLLTANAEVAKAKEALDLAQKRAESLKGARGQNAEALQKEAKAQEGFASQALARATANQMAAQNALNAARAMGDEASVKAAEERLRLAEAEVDIRKAQRDFERAQQHVAGQFAQDTILNQAGRINGVGDIINGAMQGSQAGVYGAIAGASLAFLNQSKAMQSFMAAAGEKLSQLANAVGNLLTPIFDAAQSTAVLAPAVRMANEGFDRLRTLFDGGIGRQVGYLNVGLQRMADGLVPATEIASKLTTVFDSTFGPTINRLANSLGMFGSIIGQALMPTLDAVIVAAQPLLNLMGAGLAEAFELLFDAAQSMGVNILHVAAAFDYVVSTLSGWAQQLVDQLHVWFSAVIPKAVGDAMDVLAGQFSDTHNAFGAAATAASNSADVLARQQFKTADATMHLAQAAQAASESLSNVPEAYRVAVARDRVYGQGYGAGSPIGSDSTSSLGGAGSSGGTSEQDLYAQEQQDQLNRDDGHRALRRKRTKVGADTSGAGDSGGNIVITGPIYISGVQNLEQLAAQLERVSKTRQLRRGGGTGPFPASTALTSGG